MAESVSTHENPTQAYSRQYFLPKPLQDVIVLCSVTNFHQATRKQLFIRWHSYYVYFN